MLAGAETNGSRWNAYLEKSVTGSVHEAELVFGTDPVTTGSVPGGGLRTSEFGDVAIRGKARQADTPDENRINRSSKQGRLLKVAPVAPPKAFNAGSVLDRTSSLLKPSLDPKYAMVFSKPKIKGEEIKVATAFHLRKTKQEVVKVPRMLASLVTNTTPDVLATAYAPPKADFAKTSPFAALLKEDKAEKVGRFTPPIAKNDHGWAKKPLPAYTFSKQEQRCLAVGIYFEARGEPVKGQAAVAQVILNRVRNPTYPSTICGVVYQNDHWRNRCQFSFACDGIKDRIKSPKHWKVATDVAMAVTSGVVWLPEVGSSTHYHATYVNPRWAGTMKRLKKIGRHIFYRTHGGGWS